MMRSLVVAFACLVAWLALTSGSVAGPACGDPDDDGDCVANMLDNCLLVPNKAPLDCDTDLDGYGNRCDGDFDNNKATNAVDFGKFVPEFKKGVDSGVGSDMDCNGVVNAVDFGKFVPQFKSGKPGPSGLFCAGKVPCDL